MIITLTTIPGKQVAVNTNFLLVSAYFSSAFWLVSGRVKVFGNSPLRKFAEILFKFVCFFISTWMHRLYGS